MPDVNSIIGEKFGILEVVRRSDRKHIEPYFWVKCECGVVKEIRKSRLRKSSTRSCGCLGGGWKHGHAKNAKRSLTWNSWWAMRSRCGFVTFSYRPCPGVQCRLISPLRRRDADGLLGNRSRIARVP